MAENSPWFSALGVIVMNPFFVPSHNAMQKALPSLPFKQLFTSKQTSFNISRLQLVPNFLASESFPWLWDVLKWLIVTPNDRANSFWFWQESWSSNAFNSASSKTFSLLPLCWSSMWKSPFLKRWNYLWHVLSLIAASPYIFESIRASAADFFILKQKIKTSRKWQEFGS